MENHQKLFKMLRLLVNLVVIAILCSNGVFGKPSKRLITSPEYLKYKERNVLSPFRALGPAHLPDLTPPKPLKDNTPVFFDREIIDVMSVFLESRNLVDKSLPEIHWSFGMSFCIPYPFGEFCMDFATTLQTADTKLGGIDTISSKLAMEPNKFQYNFDVGNFTWTSPGAAIIDEDFIEGGVLKCEGYNYRWQNVSVELSGNYGFDPTLGIQVSNLNIEFSIGNVSYNTDACWQKHFGDAEWESVPYEVLDSTEDLMKSWVDNRERDTARVQNRLNCFLSGDKFDYDLCAYDNEAHRQYNEASNILLLQMMGFGEMSRP